MPFSLMYITNSAQMAKICERAGVERIFIDMEWLGKAERQGHIDSVKLRHTVNDVANVRRALSSAELLVRINPANINTPNEVAQVIAAGADLIMLPMARTLKDVGVFVAAVNARVKTVLLLETRGAEENIDAILQAGGIDEVHIGINDLSLDYGVPFMFDLLADGTVARICERVSAYNVPYGFGGIARVGGGKLPAEKIIMEHVRLGSSRAILSRSFYNSSSVTDWSETGKFFCEELQKIRAAIAHADNATTEELEDNFRQIKELLA